MERISILSKHERLLLLEDLENGKIKIEDFSLEVHTDFVKGPKVMFIDVKCIYSKRHVEKFMITETQTSNFFLITDFTYINKIATMSFKSISGAMGIFKIDSKQEGEIFYKELLRNTNEFHEFLSKALSEK